MMTTGRNLSVTFDVAVEERDGHWVATSVPLHITASGDTDEEAVERVANGLKLLLATAGKHNDLLDYLDRRRITYSVSSGRRVALDVPLELSPAM